MPNKHKVEHGEWVAKIASFNGLPESVVWDDPANASIKASRPNPNLLFKGDKIHVPDIELKEVDKGAGAKHVFQLFAITAKLHLKLEHYIDTPLETKYVLQIGGLTFKGKSKGGEIKHDIPILSEEGELELPDLGIKLRVLCGHLSEIEPWKSDRCHIWGTQARCNNLSFPAGPVDGIKGRKTRAGTRRFQNWARRYFTQVGLAEADLSEEDGQPGPLTAKCLKHIHGV